MLIRYCAVGVLSLLALPGIASAADEAKVENCAITSDIVAEAVAQRRSDSTQAQAQDFILSDEAGYDAKYDQAIPMLVDWVYTLDSALLSDGTAGAFEAQCLDYQP